MKFKHNSSFLQLYYKSTRQDIVSETKVLLVFRVEVVIVDIKWSSESKTISMPIGPHE